MTTKKQIIDIPVIISHFNGAQKYLLCALKSAKKYNNTVVLLGDASNSKLWENHWDCVNRTSDKYALFLEYYKKMSFYPDDYENSFWKRIFMVELWLQETRNSEFILLDSDIITFSNYTDSIRPFFQDLKPYAGLMTPKYQDNYLWTSSCHFSYWTKEALDDFIEFSINVYKGNEFFKSLEEKWSWHRENNVPGGICEMTLLYFWSRDNSDVIKFGKIKNGTSFDHNFNISVNYDNNEYLMEGNYKKVKFSKGTPIFHNLVEGRDVIFNCIHCQGKAKKLMFYFNNSFLKYLYIYEPIFTKVHHFIIRKPLEFILTYSGFFLRGVRKIFN